MMRWRGGAVLIVVLLSGCTGPVRSFAVYGSKAGQTAKAVGSAVETARLAVSVTSADKAYGRYVAQVLAEAEEDATAAQGTFDAIQPPDRRADRRRSDLDDLLTQAVSSLADMRIAARRGDLTDLPRLAAPLAEVSGVLADFSQAHA
jgi:hypothetical protein